MGRPTADRSVAAQIILGASKAFGLKAYADTRVEDILRYAEVSRRTFYRFFRNKDAVFESLFLYGVAMLEKSVADSIDPKLEVRQQLEVAIEAFLSTLSSWGRVGVVMVAESMQPGSRFAPLRRRAVQNFTGMFEEQYHRYATNTDAIDPLLFSSLLAAMEHVALVLLQESEDGNIDIARGKAIMLHLITASFANNLDDIAPRPAQDSA